MNDHDYTCNAEEDARRKKQRNQKQDSIPVDTQREQKSHLSSALVSAAQRQHMTGSGCFHISSTLLTVCDFLDDRSGYDNVV